MPNTNNVMPIDFWIEKGDFREDLAYDPDDYTARFRDYADETGDVNFDCFSLSGTSL